MIMAAQERNRMHPHKFALWVAMASIVMAFAGLTSAYIVKQNVGGFLHFPLPKIFTFSTVVIILSSVTAHLSVKNFKAREMSRYKILILLTAVLGLAFIAMQWIGFQQVEAMGIPLIGRESNPSASFLAVIAGLHMVHVLGGIIAIFIMLIKAFSIRKKTYASTGVEIMATYWHFVDILWIYLFVFFLFIVQ